MNNINNLSRVYSNIYNMFEYRKINPDQKQLNEFDVIKKIKIDSFIEITANNQKVIIYLYNKDMYNIDDFLKKWEHQLPNKHTGYEVLLITEKPLKIPSQKYINSLNKQNKNGIIKNTIYKIFSDNIPKHVSVPEHRIMTNEETIKFLKEINKEKKDLPVIRKNEGMSIWLGVRPGQLVEIKRPHEVSVYELAYRICK